MRMECVSHDNIRAIVSPLLRRLFKIDSDIDILKNGIESDGGSALALETDYETEFDGGGAIG